MQAQGSNSPPSQHPDMPGENPPFTVANAMFICGINSQKIFQGDSQAEQISSEVFDDDFMSCRAKIVKKLNDNLKSYSTLTDVNGQIYLNPGQKQSFKAFIQWNRDQY